jgi:hypothetical protein
VSPGDYDLLWTNRFLADPLQPYGRVDVGADAHWLMTGCSARAGTRRNATAPSRSAGPMRRPRCACRSIMRRRFACRSASTPFAYPNAPAQT